MKIEIFFIPPTQTRWLYLRYLYTFHEYNTAVRSQDEQQDSPNIRLLCICFSLYIKSRLCFDFQRSQLSTTLHDMHTLPPGDILLQHFFVYILLHDQHSSPVCIHYKYIIQMYMRLFYSYYAFTSYNTSAAPLVLLQKIENKGCFGI